MTVQEQGVVVGPDARDVLPNPVGGQIMRKASEHDTHGAYTLFENSMPPHCAGPRPHIHHRHDEAFYVLDGVLTVHIGIDTITAPAGALVLVPRGVVHQPANLSAAPVRFLLLFSPGGMDQFFADAAAQRIPLQTPAADPAALAALADFSARYHFELAALPAAP